MKPIVKKINDWFELQLSSENIGEAFVLGLLTSKLTAMGIKHSTTWTADVAIVSIPLVTLDDAALMAQARAIKVNQN